MRGGEVGSRSPAEQAAAVTSLLRRSSSTLLRSYFGYAALAVLTLALASCGTAPTVMPSSTPIPSPAAAATPVVTATAPQPTPSTGAAPTITPPSTPSASPAAAASPVVTTPAPEPPTRVTTPDVQVGPLADQAMAFLDLFTREYSPRASATEEERRAAEFLAAELEALGYTVQVQPLTVDAREATVRTGPEDRDVRSLPMTLSGEGEASGSLVYVGKARDGDLPPEPLTGKVALIQRGEITFNEKVAQVADAGAVGAIVYNNAEGLFAGTMAEQASIPAVSISRQEGEAILGALDAGEVEASVSVLFETRDTQNVIAERLGTAAEPKTIVLGGHYDTVPNVSGANDNGSGIATLMTVAAELAETDHPMTLRFIAFGSEETGLNGSRFYVDQLGVEERLEIEMMLNFDALGTGPMVGIEGTVELVTRALDIAQAAGIAAEMEPPMAGASSDHASFQRAGIPVAFFLANDFSRIHTPQDRIEFVEAKLMGGSAALAVLLVRSLATP